MQVNQKQAVRNAVLSVLPDYEIGGEVILKSVLDGQAELKTEIKAILFEAFRNGEVTYKAEFASKVEDDKELKKYISGLLNNWIRKDKGFNNGESYTPNPELVGTRAGSGDEMVREMKKLLKVTTDAEAKAEIQQAIDERIAEIKPAAAPVNADALPEHLRKFVK